MKDWELVNMVRRVIASGDLDKKLDDLDGAIRERRRIVGKAKLEAGRLRVQAGSMSRVIDSHPKSEMRGVHGQVDRMIFENTTAVLVIDTGLSEHVALIEKRPRVKRTGTVLVSVKYLEAA